MGDQKMSSQAFSQEIVPVNDYRNINESDKPYSSEENISPSCLPDSLLIFESSAFKMETDKKYGNKKE